MNTPYTTRSGLRIGSKLPPLVRVLEQGREAERVQRALLRWHDTSANDSRVMFGGAMTPPRLRVGRRSIWWRLLRTARATWRYVCSARAW